MNNNNKKPSKYDQFLGTYSGRRLLEAHSLTEEGTWQIRGEDPNCDLGGHHHMPDLGTVQGKLDDIIAYAVELPGFWQWGSGGEIRAVHVRKIDSDSIRRENELRARKRELETELAHIEKQLKK